MLHAVKPISSPLVHDLSHIEAFLFDMDDVLYPHGAFLTGDDFWEVFNTFAAEQNDMPYDEAAAITERMRQNKANDLIRAWADYAKFDLQGFTNRLDAVEIAQKMQPCTRTLALLQNLKGRRVVFTNAHTTHAERILAHLQMAEMFEAVSDYMTRGHRLKPEPAIYHELVSELNLNPSRCVMIEDTAKNLVPAHDLGMTTVLIHPAPEAAHVAAPYIHRHHTTLVDWLESIKQ